MGNALIERGSIKNFNHETLIAFGNSGRYKSCHYNLFNLFNPIRMDRSRRRFVDTFVRVRAKEIALRLG